MLMPLAHAPGHAQADFDVYPYLPRAYVETISAASDMALAAGAAE